MRAPISLVLFALCAAACDGGPELPGPTPGGGVSDWDPGMYQGVVYVVDARDAPIEGAIVYLGNEEIGTTDADGVVRFDSIGSVTAVVGDRAVTVDHWYTRAITIPIPDPEPPRAIVTATLTGFGSIAFDGDYLIARAGFTFTPRIAGAENAVVPLADESITCEGGADCTVRLATRTGALRVFLAIAQGFDEGIAGDRTDDRIEPLAIAISDLAELEDGDEAVLDLTLLDDADVVAVEVTPDSSPPGGFAAVVGVPGALTASGVLIWPAELGPRALIPRVIDGETAAHWVIGQAVPTPVASSSAIRRGLTLTGGVEPSADLPTPPDDVTIDGRAVAIVPDASGPGVLYRVDVFDDAGALVWTTYLPLEGSAFGLPSVVALPTEGTMRATIIQHDGLDPTNISFATVEERWTARASRTVPLNP